MNPIGYLTNRKDGIYGARGYGYDYITAANGVFIEAEGPLMAARAHISYADIRGLGPMDPKLVLRNGKIPQALFDLTLNLMLVEREKERYVGIVWHDGRYTLYLPEQQRQAARVVYQPGESIILDLHSHGAMGAFFSDIDNRDEQALKIYGVIGKLDGYPEIKLRYGVYGYFTDIRWSDVFEGTLTGAIEARNEYDV